MIKLEFKVNPYYLLAHSIERCYEEKPFKEWVNLVKDRWENKCLPLNRASREFSKISTKEVLHSTFKATEETFLSMLQTPEFEKLLKETEEYKNWIESEWDQKGEIALQILKEITGLAYMSVTIPVYITHPKLPNGTTIVEKNTICWGSPEHWKNYSIVYLCHELLHILTYQKYQDGEVMHAIIELATDNELRIRLNNQKEYFKEDGWKIGHGRLKNLEEKLYPLWQEYLEGKTEAKDILDFEKLALEFLKKQV